MHRATATGTGAVVEDPASANAIRDGEGRIATRVGRNPHVETADFGMVAEHERFHGVAVALLGATDKVVVSGGGFG